VGEVVMIDVAKAGLVPSKEIIAKLII